MAGILNVSLKTVKRRLRRFNLSRSTSYSDVTDVNLDAMIRDLAGGNEQLGPELVRAQLRAEGVRIQRRRVRESMVRINPRVAALRAMSQRLHRRSYRVAGPNSLWHIDGNHKLIRKLPPHFGIVRAGRLRTAARRTPWAWSLANQEINDQPASIPRNKNIFQREGGQDRGGLQAVFPLRKTNRKRFLAARSLKTVDSILDIPPPYLSKPAARKKRAATVPTTRQTRGDRAREQLISLLRHTDAAATAGLPVLQGLTEETEEDEADAFPMIQVPTQAGGIGLVYRAWTELDIRKATSHLPPCKNSFLPTVPEIRRLLMINLGPMEYAKIRHLLPEDPTDDPVLHHPNLANRANDDYNDLLEDLSSGIETVFPDRIDMSHVANTKQNKGETVEDCLRLLIDTAALLAPLPPEQWLNFGKLISKTCF
ncbi:uncharacterized protein LOC120561142 [Perca fluviatilis]|uniref:uncharacterized protein LOC120561142 n=1 Tax=Perca fluviatilis TaxID=8168 RepID=UPI00196235B8|nr:uncharacterized protein LOC120561142 [Perca fluviatilis]XP_039660046.1 uncharacterized protein LOC120561142 [Perca fluviatilis]